VTFRQFGQTNFAFNYPFATNQPPYPYILNDIGEVPYLATNYAGVGKVGPVVLAQPQSRTVVPGQSAALSVTAMGASLLAYQWYFNTNTPLANATNAALTVSNAGTYTVVITNLFGSATSSVAVLTIGPASVSIVGTPVLTNGVFHVLFSGLANQDYAVDRATNILGPWELGYTNLTSDANGLFHLFDTASPSLAARYFRVRYP
jgi:hypothetical protein